MVTPTFKRVRYLILGLVVLGGALPLLGYVATLGSVPTLAPGEAIALLSRSDAGAFLLDIRPSQEFERQHVVGAISFPLNHIRTLTSLDSLPVLWQGKKLLVISAVDFDSVEAVRHLRAIGVKDISQVRGGLQEWIAAIKEREHSNGEPFVTIKGISPFRIIPRFDQWGAMIAAFGFKPLYMILSLLLALTLWRVWSPDLAALKWSMVAFYVGEASCALNYLLFDSTSYLSEYFHSYGMVVAFGFFIYALMEGMDSRVMRVTAWGQRCAALELCGRCLKSEEVDCGARKILLLMIPITIFLGFIPLQADFSSVSYNVAILGRTYSYFNPVPFQIFEKRYCPLIGMALSAMAFITLWRQPRRPVLPSVWVLWAAGLGALAFSFFRLLLGAVYENHLVWSTFWEELTELIFIAAIWGFMLLFRHTLLTESTGVFRWPLVSRILNLPTLPASNLSAHGLPPAVPREVVLVACEVLKDPLMRCAPQGLLEKARFLEYGLHRSPDRLRRDIQTIIDDLPQPSLVVLGYGLCGNGLGGIKAGPHTLLVPRVDDCIPLILGSYESYWREAKIEPATVYLSKGWLKSGSHPLNEFHEYRKRYGDSLAEMIIDTQYRHCRRLAFVADNQMDMNTYREQAEEVAQFCKRWGTRYEEIIGCDAYIRRLVEMSQTALRADDDFLVVPAGGMIENRQFLRSG